MNPNERFNANAILRMLKYSSRGLPINMYLQVCSGLVFRILLFNRELKHYSIPEMNHALLELRL